MDKDTKQSIEEPTMEVDDTPAAQSSASRRRFTRSAVIGGAVVLSLGNRAAWSGNDGVCLSGQTMASAAAYQAGNRASMSPTTARAIDAYYREAGKPNRVKGPNPDSEGGSCVVQEQPEQGTARQL